jgi:hypothetical protein
MDTDVLFEVVLELESFSTFLALETPKNLIVKLLLVAYTQFGHRLTIAASGIIAGLNLIGSLIMSVGVKQIWCNVTDWHLIQIGCVNNLLLLVSCCSRSNPIHF